MIFDSSCSHDSLDQAVTTHLSPPPPTLWRALLPPSKGVCGCVAACVCLSGLLSLSSSRPRSARVSLDSHGGVSWETPPPDLSAAWSAQSRCIRRLRAIVAIFSTHIASHPILLHSHPRSACLHSHLLASFICCIATTVIADLLCCPRSPHRQPATCLPSFELANLHTSLYQLTGRP